MTLSSAERQRRYIARLKEKAAGSVTNEAVSNEFMRLKAFVDQLERENATLKEKLATVTNEVAGLKAENKALKDKLAAAKRREDDLLKEVSKLKVDSWFAPKGAMTAAQFKAIIKCLHPDTVSRLHDEGVTKQFNEAFKTVNGLRSQLVK
jgi:regulator of replication initiation timing